MYCNSLNYWRWGGTHILVLLVNSLNDGRNETPGNFVPGPLPVWSKQTKRVWVMWIADCPVSSHSKQATTVHLRLYLTNLLYQVLRMNDRSKSEEAVNRLPYCIVKCFHLGQDNPAWAPLHCTHLCPFRTHRYCHYEEQQHQFAVQHSCLSFNIYSCM